VNGLSVIIKGVFRRLLGGRAAAVFAALALVIAFAGLQAAPASAARSYKSRLQDIRERKKRIEADIRKLREEKGSLSEELRKLDGDLLKSQEELEGVRAELAEQEKEKARLEEEHESAKADLEDKRGLLADRSVEIYKQGDMTYLDVVLGAQSFSDFIDRLFYLQVIVENDGQLIEQVEDKIAEVVMMRVAVEQKINEVKEIKEEIAARIEEIKATRSTKQDAINAISRDEALYLKQVKELEEESKRIQADIRRLTSSGGGYKGEWKGSFLRPAPGPITSGFGYRRHPIFGVTKMHTGVDIDGETGDPIKAGGDGKVIWADWRGGYGKCIIIDHGKGVSTLYGHLSAFGVKTGDVVKAGQVIGRMGSTGYSTGSHLHFEVRINGDPVDPMRKL
jgi:murein DD-endopeptidase MepM/ murein hydrolase activator NlpD